jgi:hypothetical protein
MASMAHVGVLTSWKDIARYMGKGVRTVQRWEADFGLPVRRPNGSGKKAVLARPRDLDAWIAMRCSTSPACVKANSMAPVLVERTSLAVAMETYRTLLRNQRELRQELEQVRLTYIEHLNHWEKQCAQHRIEIRP